MPVMDGIVTIVQEGRFQLADLDGVHHLFELSYKAALEPEDLPPLQEQQARIRVNYRPAKNIIGFAADAIARLDR